MECLTDATANNGALLCRGNTLRDISYILYNIIVPYTGGGERYSNLMELHRLITVCIAPFWLCPKISSILK